VGIQLEDRPAAGRRSWFTPPRLRTAADEEDRHASWLELFFDLVFVVAITELSHQLAVDHSADGFLRFADDVARGVHSAAFALAAGLAAVLVGLVFVEGMLRGPEQWTAA
jgi:Bacterial low temperature requirement A protein (LtrA)